MLSPGRLAMGGIRRDYASGGAPSSRESLFEPDTITGIQWQGRWAGRSPTAQQPEYRLMRAVLESAIEDVLTYSRINAPHARQNVWNAFYWMYRDDEPRWLCSFAVICDVLDLDAGAIRAGLSALRERVLRGERPTYIGPRVMRQHVGALS